MTAKPNDPSEIRYAVPTGPKLNRRNREVERGKNFTGLPNTQYPIPSTQYPIPNTQSPPPCRGDKTALIFIILFLDRNYACVRICFSAIVGDCQIEG